MFDFVRKHNKLMQILLSLLIFPSFVMFGIDGYNRFREKGETVAKVGGMEISQSDWDAAHKNEVERLRASRPDVDIKQLDSPEVRYRSLERLVRDRVLAMAAEKAHLITTDAQLAQSLESMPAIAQLRQPDGRLDIARYQQLLAAQGLSPEMFEANVRADLTARQVLMGVADTGFATVPIANQSLKAFLERRSIQVAVLKAADFAGKVNATQADLEAFYQQNPGLFQAPEQAAIEYVVLDMDAVSKSIVPAEQDLKTYYEQNAQRLAGTEQRRASHILITAGKDSAAADRQKAKALAEDLLAQARKAPGNFAALAKQHSQDPGSAPNGGDLDYFSRGAMVKPFEDAVFAMKPGEISDVVESEFGYHIIKLVDVKAPKQKSFEEMKPELEAQVRKQLAQRKYAESAEIFSNSVYEQADSLKPVADKLKLDIRVAKQLTRTPTPGVTGVLANPKLLAAIFSPDSIERKHNTEALELGGNQLVSARVTAYSPARTLPFDEVKSQVKEKFVAVRSAEMARQEGAAKLAAWRSQPASAAYPEAVTISRQDGKNLPPQVVDAALRADSKALPLQQGVDLGHQGYALLKVNKVLDRETPDVNALKQELSQYTREWTTAENLAFFELLKQEMKVKILVPKPAAKLPG